MANEAGATELGPEEVEGHALEQEREAVDQDRDAVADEPDVEGHAIELGSPSDL